MKCLEKSQTFGDVTKLRPWSAAASKRPNSEAVFETVAGIIEFAALFNFAGGDGEGPLTTSAGDGPAEDCVETGSRGAGGAGAAFVFPTSLLTWSRKAPTCPVQMSSPGEHPPGRYSINRYPAQALDAQLCQIKKERSYILTMRSQCIKSICRAGIRQ